MKQTFTILALLITVGLSAQTKYQFKPKEHIAPTVMVLLAGAADGLNQTISYNWKGFKHAFPHANTHYWWPTTSFLNKYKGGKKENGPAYFGSTSFLVWTTDGYHMTRFVEHLFLAGALSVKITQSKKKWYYYVAEAAGYWLVNRVGFAVVYNSFK